MDHIITRKIYRIIVVTQTDRPKVVRNNCTYNRKRGVFVLTFVFFNFRMYRGLSNVFSPVVLDMNVKRDTILK